MPRLGGPSTSCRCCLLSPFLSVGLGLCLLLCLLVVVCVGPACCLLLTRFLLWLPLRSGGGCVCPVRGATSASCRCCLLASFVRFGPCRFVVFSSWLLFLSLFFFGVVAVVVLCRCLVVFAVLVLLAAAAAAAAPSVLSVSLWLSSASSPLPFVVVLFFCLLLLLLWLAPTSRKRAKPTCPFHRYLRCFRHCRCRIYRCRRRSRRSQTHAFCKCRNPRYLRCFLCLRYRNPRYLRYFRYCAWRTEHPCPEPNDVHGRLRQNRASMPGT